MKNNQSKPITKRNAHGSMKSRMLALFLTLTILLTLLASCAAPAPSETPTPEPTPTPEATTEAPTRELPAYMLPQETPEPVPTYLDYLYENYGEFEILTAVATVSESEVKRVMEKAFDRRFLEYTPCEVIESEKYILYIPEGSDYSNYTIPFFDLIIDNIEEMTGLSIITDTYKDKVIVWAWVGGNMADNNAFTISPENLLWYDVNHSDYTAGRPFVFAHEAAHVIHFRNTYPWDQLGRIKYGDTSYVWPEFFVEGFAMFVDYLIGLELSGGYTKEQLPGFDSGVIGASSYVFNDLATSLNSGKTHSYDFGLLIYMYIYYEHGMDSVIDTLIALSELSVNATQHEGVDTTISDTLGVNIIDALPVWVESAKGTYFDIWG